MANFPITTFRELVTYWQCDLQRYDMGQTFKAWLRAWYIAGFRYSFFMRACRYFNTRKLLAPFFFISRVALRHYSVKYGFQIPWQTSVGPGLHIGHYGTIIVNPESRIGANCNITVGVLLGLAKQKDGSVGYPSVGNRVFLGNSCKILGSVIIGNDACIAPQSVVTRDVAQNEIVGGGTGQNAVIHRLRGLRGQLSPFLHVLHGTPNRQLL